MKLTIIFRILAAALLAVLLAIPIPATPALAEGAITLSSSQAAIGQEITISGSGFYASNTTSSRGVNILFGKHPGSSTMDYSATIYQKVQVAELNSNGTFRATFSVPARLAGGTTKEDVVRGSYYIYLTYYYPPFSPGTSGTDGPNIELITPFAVVVGTITTSPESGAVGTEVNINGTYFGVAEGITVRYDGLEATIAGDGDTDSSGAFGATKITIPPSIAGQHSIIVSGNNSGTVAQATFTVKPKLAIAPTAGTAGTLITVSGSGFGSQLDVTPTFGGDAVTPGRTDGNGSFSLRFGALSKAAGSYDIAVIDGNGNSDKASFSLTIAKLSLSPDNGNVGSEVSINGSNFLPSRPITVTFNEAKVATATSDAQGSFRASFTVPVLATGSYKVTVRDGSNNSTADFSITASADISPKTSLASPGQVGSQLSVSGEGFTAGGSVTITYDGNQVATATVRADRSFSATFNAPAGRAGEHIVIATDGTNIRQFTFIMEATPPAAPVPLKPEMNIKSNAKTYFDWQDVTDPSGTTYTLQIATNENFSPSSIVLEKTGLTQSEYTLTSEQRLKSAGKEAPYYWHVRAVDGAGNQSLWSGTGAFYVATALALSKPVTYILIGIGILALVIFAFWLGRRTAYY